MTKAVGGSFRGWKSERGSITLEASLVIPWVLMLTFLVMLLAIGMADRAIAYFSAASEADRAAFAWSHTAADVRTGAYPAGEYDSLYWRLKDDALLAGLFGDSAGAESARVVWGGSDGDEEGDGDTADTADDSLAAKKLRRTAERLAYRPAGAVTYRNQVWRREISVAALGGLPGPLEAWGWSGSRGTASALVAEPAESVRSFELLRYFRAKMKRKGDGAEAYRSRAAAVLAGKQ